MSRARSPKQLTAFAAAFIAVAAVLSSAPDSHAADPRTASAGERYPVRPIRVIVPTSPGGVTDIVARAVTPALAEALGQPLVVDNRAGAGGIIGTDLVARAAPDGHTLLAVFDSFVSNPYVFRNVPYSTVRDFAPVSMLVRGPQLFVVHPRINVTTFAEFLALAKSGRTPINYATAGAATSSRLSVELFKSTAKIAANQVHYKGGGPALNDLLAGHVEAMIASAGLVLPHARSGRLRVLAVTSRDRSPLVPEAPAVSEFFPQFEAQSWVGVLAPAATPHRIIQRLHGEISKVLASAVVGERFLQLGYETVGSPPAQFGAWIRYESEKWGRVVRDQNITAE